MIEPISNPCSVIYAMMLFLTSDWTVAKGIPFLTVTLTWIYISCTSARSNLIVSVCPSLSVTVTDISPWSPNILPSTRWSKIVWATVSSSYAVLITIFREWAGIPSTSSPVLLLKICKSESVFTSSNNAFSSPSSVFAPTVEEFNIQRFLNSSSVSYSCPIWIIFPCS